MHFLSAAESAVILSAVLSGKLLAVLMNGLGDRNAGVRKSYALSIGCLVKVCCCCYKTNFQAAAS